MNKNCHLPHVSREADRGESALDAIALDEQASAAMALPQREDSGIEQTAADADTDQPAQRTHNIPIILVGNKVSGTLLSAVCRPRLQQHHPYPPPPFPT